PVARVSRVDLAGGVRADGRWGDELVAPAAGGAERRPARPGYVVHAHDAMVAHVGYEDLAGGVHEDTGEKTIKIELVGFAAGRAERGPARPHHVVDAYDAIVVRICHEDLSGRTHEDAIR